MLKCNLPVVIAGAGPAGSILAIRLARQGLPVAVIERDHFPRHKLCGEFISPECLEHFDELGVAEEMLAAGGDRILETKFFLPSGRSIAVPSKWFGFGKFALSLSRARMDQILLERARKSGAEIFEGAAVVGLIQEAGEIKGVKIRRHDGSHEEINGSIIVDATGRSRVLARLASKKTGASAEPKPQFVGFKAHLSGLEMSKGVCEMYSFRGGYAGLSFVENSEANLCFLARASLMKQFGTADHLVDGALFRNGRARETLRHAEKIHDWLAVSIPRFGFQQPPPVPGLLAVGDSAAFIDPFTGSGMLMAMESSELLADCVAGSPETTTELAQVYFARYNECFRRRLGVSASIRRIAYSPSLAGLVITALSASERVRQALARLTRSTVPAVSSKP